MSRRTGIRQNQPDETGFFPGQNITATHNNTGNTITGIYGGLSKNGASLKIGNQYASKENYTFALNETNETE